MELRTLTETFAIARLSPDATVPPWVGGRDLIAVVRTRNELSIVCQDESVPQTVSEVQRGFRALAVDATLDFGLSGIIADLATPLADAGIPIFDISTYDTDYVLVRGDLFEKATQTLAAAGHVIK